MTKPTPVIEVASASFRYDDKQVLDKLSFEVKRSEFLGVIGPNGAGKTTLLRLLAGLLLPASGAIKLRGKRTSEMNASHLARFVALVPQEFSVVYPFRVSEVDRHGQRSSSRS